jgi:hypothetical protein
MSLPDGRRKVKYSKVPQFQEGGDGSELFEEEVEHDEGIARPRTGKEKDLRNTEDSKGSAQKSSAQVWEERRRKAEKVLGYLGQKVRYMLPSLKLDSGS